MTHFNELTPAMIAKVIDHTYLKDEGGGVSLAQQQEAVARLVDEAHRLGAFAVCVREHMVAHARDLIERRGGGVEIASVVGFPRGDEYSTDQKIELLEKARADGATEFDVVLRVDALKRGDERVVRDELEALSHAAGDNVLKIIFETALLTDEEKVRAYRLALDALTASFGGERQRIARRFFKTSTGFARPSDGRPIGATFDDVAQMAQVSQGAVGIKPSGGIGDFNTAVAFWRAAGSRWDGERQRIDPYRFRIGSSTLLERL